MSFNLRLNTKDDGPNAWPYRKDFVLSLIKDYNPDLFGVQEALPEMASYLLLNLEDIYEYWGIGRGVNNTDEASALFFKKSIWNKLDGGHFWLSNTPFIPGSILPNVSLPRMVSWVKLQNKINDKIYHYFNTHYDYENEENRYKETVIFMDQIKNITKSVDLRTENNLIITGDFNSLYNETCMKMWTNHSITNLQDTIHAINQDPNVDYGTFHAWTGKSNNTIIDYALVSENFILEDYKIIHDTRNGRYSSDHFPIIARIKNKRHNLMH